MTTEEEDDKKGKTGRLGSAADRAGRRARRSERAVDRRVTSPVPAAALLADDDDTRRTRSGIKKSRGGQRIAVAPSRKSQAEIEPPITVRGLSLAIGVKANDLIRKLMAMNQLATINASLDEDVATMLALEFGIELEVVHAAHRRRRPARLVRVLRHVGEPRASAPRHHDSGPRRPRQDIAPGPHSQVERRRFRKRRHHPAHRRLPGRVQRPPDHFRRYPGP